MARSAKQVAAQLKAARASAAKRRGNARYAADQAKKASRRQRTNDIAQGKIKVPKSGYDWSIAKARKLDAMDALHAKLPDGAYGVNSKGGFITRESYGEQAWTSLGQYTRAKTPKPKKIANGLGPDRGWGGSGNGDGGY